MDDTGVLFGAGYAGENFSVDRELNNLEKDGKINSKFSVLLTDNSNHRFGKKVTLVNHSYCYRELLAKALFDQLIDKGIADNRIKENPKNPLVHVYIINKG